MIDKRSLTLRSAAIVMLSGLLWLYVAAAPVSAAWAAPVALVLALLTARCVLGPGRGVWLGSAVAVALTALAAALCAALDDHSFDGNIYHQEIVMALLGGWNPYAAGSEPAGLSVWAACYCKGMETAASAIVALTGRIEAGKCVNLMLIFGTAMLVYDTLRSLTSWGRRRLVAVTAIAAGNPVGLCQALTYYVDFTKYYYILLVVVAGALLTRGERRLPAALTVMAVWLSAATKLNVFFDVAVWCGVLALWLWLRCRRGDAIFVILCAGAGAMIGTLVTGWHPYVTNFLFHGSPFYPLLGAGAVDIMGSNTPSGLTGWRVPDFFISIFTPALPTYGGRLGGFGALMPLCLAVAVMSLWWSRRRVSGGLWWIAGLAVASCFFFAQSWWARYNCQLWLVVAAGAVAAPYCGPRMRRVDFGVSLAAVALAGIVALAVSVRITLRRARIYERAATEGAALYNATPQALRHFAEHGVAVRGVDGSVPPGADAEAFMSSLDEEGVPVVVFLN